MEEYEAALERLKSGNVTRVPPGTCITNDAVSMEAGRQRGSIKRGREGHLGLIAKINLAIEEQRASAREDVDGAVQVAGENQRRSRKMYLDSLAREVSLLYENQELREERDGLQAKLEQLKQELAALKRARAPVPLRKAK